MWAVAQGGEGMAAMSSLSGVQKPGTTGGQVRSDARGLEGINNVLSSTPVS